MLHVVAKTVLLLNIAIHSFLCIDKDQLNQHIFTSLKVYYFSNSNCNLAYKIILLVHVLLSWQ